MLTLLATNDINNVLLTAIGGHGTFELYELMVITKTLPYIGFHLTFKNCI